MGRGSVAIRTLPERRLEAASSLVLAARSGSGILALVLLSKMGHCGST